MKLTQISRNVHRIDFSGKQAKVALLSDLHWDNPKCDRKLLTKHLNYCKENNIPVHINGDFFCLMQGRGDKRGNKSDVRPEHNNARYIDSVINTAVEWFEPYKDILTVIGYGNHETGIIKYQETDVLQRFVDLFNAKFNTQIYTGGYGGWMVYGIDKRIFSHKYFHGSGGGGIVTKGAINLTRALEMINGFDVFSMGHVHENMCRNDVVEVLDLNANGITIKQKNLHLTITGTYKEEYGDGSKGWHVERGAPPKPLGGRILHLKVDRQTDKDSDVRVKMVDSMKFPI